MKLGTLLFATVFAAVSAWAGTPLEIPLSAVKHFDKIEVRDGGEVWVGSEAGMAHVGTVETISKATPLYHWGDEETAERWARQGSVSAGEFDSLLHGDGMVAGGGLYLSTDTIDSKMFGRKADVFTMDSELKILKNTHLDAETHITEALWPKFHELLRTAGIQGVHYRGNWINVFDPAAATSAHARALTIEDLFHSPAFAGDAPADAQHLAALDSVATVWLDTDPWMLHRAPEVQKLMKDEELTEADRDALWKRLGDDFDWITSTGPTKSVLAIKARKALHDRFVANLKKSLASCLGPDGRLLPERSAMLDGLISRAISLGVDPVEFLPEIKSPISAYRPIVPIGGARKSTQLSKNFLSSLEFIDYNDLMVELAKGNGAPWTRYDKGQPSPLIDRWREASKKDNLIDIYRVLANDPNGGFRDHRIIAGGDIKLDGKGYYHLTPREKEVLEQSPYLVSEIREDPWKKGYWLARHEYPSAATYHKFKDKLSPQLAADLESAEKAGKLTEGTEEFRHLTRRIIAELHDSVVGGKASAALQYQTLIAIHPFSDYNGRSLRMFFKRKSGYPLFMRNWDLDLLLSPEEFAVEVQIGRAQYLAIQSAIAQEVARNPGFPKLYDLPVLWQTAADAPEGSVAYAPAFVSRVKAFYADPANQDLIRHKMFLDAFNKIRESCVLNFIRGVVK